MPSKPTLLGLTAVESVAEPGEVPQAQVRQKRVIQEVHLVGDFLGQGPVGETGLRSGRAAVRPLALGFGSRLQLENPF